MYIYIYCSPGDMANKTSIHRSVFQSLLGTGPMHQCTDWKGNRMAGMHELRNVAVTLPVKLRGFPDLIVYPP